MRAAAYTYDEAGEPTIETVELPDPTPGAGEAVVEVAACSLNHSSLWRFERGEYEAPYVSGSDVTGVVEAVGEGAPVAAGDRVVLCPIQTCGTCPRCREGPESLCEEISLYRGGFAERCVVDADRLVPLPGSVTFRQAAVLPIAYMTARQMLRRAEVTAGDRVLIPGATGGVGVAAVQLAGLLGVETVGTTTAPEKAKRLPDLGVDDVVVAEDPDGLRATLEERPPVDAVVNHLGGPYTAVGLEALRRGGRMAVCGMTAGFESTIDIRDVSWDQTRLIGSTMGTQPDLAAIVELVASGRLDVEPAIDREYPLEETAAAFADLADRDVLGKLVVRPDR